MHEFARRYSTALESNLLALLVVDSVKARQQDLALANRVTEILKIEQNASY